jgi:hypothetical protein
MPPSLHLVLPWSDTVTTRKRPRRSWRSTSTTSTRSCPTSPRTASSRPRADPIAGVAASSVGRRCDAATSRSGADPSPRVERRVPSAPASFQLGQRRIPHISRGRSPEAPAHPRESPQCEGRKALLTAEIPAYPRSARKRHDRPVTPEVAGSSPVAPVKSLQTGIFCCRAGRKRPPPSFHPALIPRRKIAAQSRLESVIPAGKTTGHIAGRPLGAGCRCCAFAAVSSNEATT